MEVWRVVLAALNVLQLVLLILLAWERAYLLGNGRRRRIEPRSRSRRQRH